MLPDYIGYKKQFIYVCAVKKMLAIFFLFSYLSSTTEFGQLLKTPILFSHFVEHTTDDNMSFWEYLVHHYGGHEPDADWATDMKLPFMQHSDVLSIMVVTTKPVAIPKSPISPLWAKQFVLYRDQLIPPSYTEAVWQPPKTC